MRFRSLELHNYGPFAATRIDFETRPGCINLLLAANGAGKSVLRGAFRDLLFGIGGQTPMGFRYGYPGMRLLAEAVDGDGRTHRIGRRKGQRNTLVDGGGTALDPATLATLVGGVDADALERLFAMDTGMLRRGGAAMLESGGDLAEALFAAGGGTAILRRLRTALEMERDRLAPVRKAAGRPLYQLLDSLTAAQRKQREALVRPRDWQKRLREYEAVRAHRARLVEEEAARDAEMRHLERTRRLRPLLAAWRTAAAGAAALADAPRLPEDTAERWRKLAEVERTGAALLQQGSRTLQQRAEQLAALTPDERLLAHSLVVDGLEAKRGQSLESRDDLPRRETERQGWQDQLAGALQDLGMPWDGRTPPDLPKPPLLSAARALIARHEAASQAAATATDRLRERERQREAAQAALSSHPAPPDLTGLASLIHAARAAGEPAAVLRATAQRLRAAEARLDGALARVPGWSGTPDALVALEPPAEGVATALHTALGNAAEALRDADRAVAAVLQNRQRWEVKLEELRGGGTVPEPEAVAAARRHRDTGWSLIRRLKFDGVDAPAEAAAYAGADPLPTVFERAVDEADRLADRRDAESRRLAEIAEARRQLAALDRELAAGNAALAAAAEGHRHCLESWRTLLSPLAIPAEASLQDVQRFAAARTAAIEQREEFRRAADELENERQRQAEVAVRLAAALGSPPDRSPADLLAEADARLAAADELRTAHRRLRDRLATAEEELRQATQDAQSAQSALAAWEHAWSRCLAELGRPAGEAPAAVATAIDLVERARQATAEIARLERRIDGMHGRIDTYANEVRQVVEAAAPDLMDRPSDVAVAALRERLAKARRVQAETETLRRQLAADEANVRAQQAELEAFARDKADLRSAIGGDADADVEERLALAAQRRQAEAAREQALALLQEVGESRSVEQLDADDAATDWDALERGLLQLPDELARIRREREEEAARARELELEERALGTAETALEAEQERQAALAGLARVSGEALRLDVAAGLLRLAMERLARERGQGLPARIGAIFAQLTGGACTGIAVEEDDAGNAGLLAIEAEGAVRKRVEELSEGTRDQLFLALRLAMLMDHAAQAPAPPFVADDLLQSFDDARCGHALAALTELSQHLQVILLTHHRHVLDLARGLPEGALHVCRFSEAA